MRIENIVLTKREMNEAVSDWLSKHGVTVNVRDVDTHGYPHSGFDIDCSTEPEAAPALPEIKPITTPLALEPAKEGAAQ